MMRSRQVIAVVAGLMLFAAACGGGDSTASESSTTVAPPTTQATTTSSEPATTTTVAEETTTTVEETTTTTEGPQYIKPEQDDLLREPGVYRVVWSGPAYTITLTDPTYAWLYSDKTTVGYHPPTESAWHHPDVQPDQDFTVTEYRFLCDYGGGSCEEVEIPDDPMAFIADHRFLASDEPTTVTVDGHDGKQIDVTVTAAPEEGGKLKFGGFPDMNHSEWPEGAALRITFVEISGETVWMLTMSTSEGFEQAVEYSEALIAGIDFD